MIYTGSRYANTNLYNRNGVNIFERRELKTFNTDNSTKHIVIQSDTLSTLAYFYYGDSQLWWVLLEANPQFTTVFDIKVGDILQIPSKEEVIKNVF